MLDKTHVALMLNCVSSFLAFGPVMQDSILHPCTHFDGEGSVAFQFQASGYEQPTFFQLF